MMEEKKIDELVYYIQKNDYEHACECFEQNTDKLNANQRIVLCTRLFDKINKKIVNVSFLWYVSAFLLITLEKSLEI